MKPLISVNIVTYNSEKFISKSISSVINQSFTRWEIIIVDNGSTDNTIKIIEEFTQNYKKIKLYRINNPDQPKARNIAIKNSSASLIAVLDSDDECERNRLEIQFNYMKQNKSTDFLGSYTKVINENSKTLYRNKYPLNSNEIKFNFLFGNPIAHSTLMFRKNFNLFYDERLKFSQDREMMTRNIIKNIYSNIPIPLVRFRKHHGQKNPKKLKIQKINEFNNLKRNHKFLFNNSLEDKYIKTIIATRHSKKCNLRQLKILAQYLLLTQDLFNKKIFKIENNYQINIFSKSKFIDFCVMCDSSTHEILKLYYKNYKLFSTKGLIIIFIKRVLNLLK